MTVTLREAAVIGECFVFACVRKIRVDIGCGAVLLLEAGVQVLERAVLQFVELL